MDSRFPDKLFYRIGDVSEITGIKPHILRYWEAEFRVLHPRKNEAGQRVYERRDVELVIEIKKLLYEQRYTISGMCRQELRGLLALLERTGSGYKAGLKSQE
jgi:DNA-binding transcriptional MerR regulator